MRGRRVRWTISVPLLFRCVAIFVDNKAKYFFKLEERAADFLFFRVWLFLRALGLVVVLPIFGVWSDKLRFLFSHLSNVWGSVVS